MLVEDFIKELNNYPPQDDRVSSMFASFCTLLEEYSEERCSVLLGKIRAQLKKSWKLASVKKREARR